MTVVPPSDYRGRVEVSEANGDAEVVEPSGPPGSLTDRIAAVVGRSCAAVGEHDPHTARHLDQIGVVSGVVARGLAGDDVVDLRTAEWIEVLAPLHDLGKLATPVRILRKPGRLDDDEWAIVRRHPEDGKVLARDLIADVLAGDLADDEQDDAELVVDLTTSIVELHHETLDGSGYPHGLTDAEIPVAARVVAVADVFDALTAVRSYKEAWTTADAVAELARLVDNGRLDGRCVAVLERSTEELEDRLRDVRPDRGV